MFEILMKYDFFSPILKLNIGTSIVIILFKDLFAKYEQICTVVNCLFVHMY